MLKKSIKSAIAVVLAVIATASFAGVAPSPALAGQISSSTIRVSWSDPLLAPKGLSCSKYTVTFDSLVGGYTANDSISTSIVDAHGTEITSGFVYADATGYPTLYDDIQICSTAISNAVAPFTMKIVVDYSYRSRYADERFTAPFPLVVQKRPSSDGWVNTIGKIADKSTVWSFPTGCMYLPVDYEVLSDPMEEIMSVSYTLVSSDGFSAGTDRDIAPSVGQHTLRVSFCENVMKVHPGPYTLRRAISFRSSAGLADIISSESLNVSAPKGSTSTPAKKKTIYCLKGKSLKTVTAVTPKCPAGYKKI